MKLSEVDSMSLSTLACVYFLCRSCGIIDRDSERSRIGHRCGECDKEGDGGTLAFPISIRVLVDLIQQSYHSTSPASPPNSPQGSDVGPVLYFCTLREALLNSFLINHLRAQAIPESLISKLLDDNKLASQKFGGLFTTVTGGKWSEAVAAASRRASFNFTEVSELMRTAAERRNDFLHSGRSWSFTREFATRCVDSVADLTYLFAELHNEYTRPYIHRDP
jgi:hypothetical protein